MMKSILVLFTLTWLQGCRQFAALNNRIYEAQKKAVLTSPYKSAAGTIGYVDVQKESRRQIFSELTSKEDFAYDASKDTIYITETFDATCFYCPSDWIKVVWKKTLYTIIGEIAGHRGRMSYKTKTEPFNLKSNDYLYQEKNGGIIEIVSKIQNREPWASNPLMYGDDRCGDGNHTIVTVIYPNEKIEALYVRCWRPSSYRKTK